MNNISKEEHHLLRFDSPDWPSLNPLQELVDGDKQVGEAPEHFWSGPTRSRPQTVKGQVMGIVWNAWASK
jgi:hypothetical protein